MAVKNIQVFFSIFLGVYVPTLSLLLIQTLQNDSSLKINFKGFLIGNGFESFRRLDVSSKFVYIQNCHLEYDKTWL